MKPYLLIALMLNIGAAQADDSITWPELNQSYLKTGDFVSISNLRSVGMGQNYDQIRLALGNPHFSEGLGRPRAFNYAFNFYTNAAKTEWVTCQYQVHFDQSRHVDGRYWRDSNCGKYVDEVPKKPIVLSSDGMFAFGRSGLNDLQVAGRDNLTQLSSKILTEYRSLRTIDVVGHTDRIGSVASNLALSQARANTVKAFFVSKGIDAHLITARGVGASMPVKYCDGIVSVSVIECLLPNRRVEVNIVGEVK